MSQFQKILKWYEIHRKGYGTPFDSITINTIQNDAGVLSVRVSINIEKTCLENKSFFYTKDNGDNDWMVIETDKNYFTAIASIYNLENIYKIFLDDFFINSFDSAFEYEVYLPLNETELLFIKAFATITRDLSFKITRIDEINNKSLRELITADTNGWKFKNSDPLPDLTHSFQVGEVIDVFLKRTEVDRIRVARKTS